MAVLPPGQFWTFSDHGILLEDWLFTNSNTKEILKSDNLTYRYDEINVPEELKLLTFIVYPILPAITCILSIINTVNGVKMYTCQSSLKYRPRPGRLLHQMIAFTLISSVLTCIITLICLPKYVPICSSMMLNAYFLISQLPALLTLASTFRLTEVWLIAVSLADRFAFLTKTFTNPLTSLFINYRLPYSKTMPPHMSSNARHSSRNYGHPKEEESRCMFTCFHNCRQNFRNSTSLFAAKFCHINDMDLECCYNCRRNCEIFSRKYGLTKKKREPQLIANETEPPCIEKFKYSLTSVTKSISSTIFFGLLVSILCLFTCLPQLRAYKLYNLHSSDIKFTYNSRKNNIVSAEANWKLENNRRHTLYEYYLASVTLVLPATILFVVLCMILKTLCRANYKVTKLLQNLQSDLRELHVPQKNLVHKILPWLIRDSWYITVISLIKLITWLPSSIINTSYQLTLLVQNDTYMIENVPWRILFCVAEINASFGDLIIQIMIFVLFTCELKLFKSNPDERFYTDSHSSIVSSDNVHDLNKINTPTLICTENDKGNFSNTNSQHLEQYQPEVQTVSTNITPSTGQNSNSMMSSITPNCASNSMAYQKGSAYFNEDKAFFNYPMSNTNSSKHCSFSMSSGQENQYSPFSLFFGNRQQAGSQMIPSSPRPFKHSYEQYISSCSNSNTSSICDRMQPNVQNRDVKHCHNFSALSSPSPLPHRVNNFVSPTPSHKCYFPMDKPMLGSPPITNSPIFQEPSNRFCHSYADVDILANYTNSPSKNKNCVIFEEDETPSATMIGDTMDSNRNGSIDNYKF